MQTFVFHFRCPVKTKVILNECLKLDHKVIILISKDEKMIYEIACVSFTLLKLNLTQLKLEHHTAILLFFFLYIFFGNEIITKHLDSVIVSAFLFL